MKSSLRKINCLGLILLVCSLLLSALPCPVDAAPAKNVILLMTDGTSSTHITLTRWYKGAPLALDSILVGGLRTYSAESIITDSAPAATAFATGYKSNSKFIGVLPEKTTVPGVSAIAPGDENPRRLPMGWTALHLQVLAANWGRCTTACAPMSRSSCRHARPRRGWR